MTDVYQMRVMYERPQPVFEAVRINTEGIGQPIAAFWEEKEAMRYIQYLNNLPAAQFKKHMAQGPHHD